MDKIEQHAIIFSRMGLSFMPQLHIMMLNVHLHLIFPKDMYGHYIQHMILSEQILQPARFCQPSLREIIMMRKPPFRQMEGGLCIHQS